MYIALPREKRFEFKPIISGPPLNNPTTLLSSLIIGLPLNPCGSLFNGEKLKVKESLKDLYFKLRHIALTWYKASPNFEVETKRTLFISGISFLENPTI
jgi:hypothetical protein